MTSEKKQIVVLGAGVVGLTTAVLLQEQKNINVTIVAETLPSDPKSIRYTSQWAGAIFQPGSEDEERQKILLETYHKMLEVSSPGREAEKFVLHITCVDYTDEPLSGRHLYSHMPDFKELDPKELIEGAASGISYSTITLDTPRYINWLMSKFIANGGSVVRQSIHHINQIIEGGPNAFRNPKHASAPDGIVVCTGIGTRGLGGVEDKDVYPIRGQTVLVRAPWIRNARSMYSSDSLTYIIPRASGDVVLGGIMDEDDWYPVPRPETSKAILTRTFAICPELAPPEVRAARSPTIEDVLPLVIEEGCGLRPARRSGLRLEVEKMAVNDSKDKVPVVYNYGHGSGGFHTSWGSARRACKLLIESLNV